MSKLRKPSRGKPKAKGFKSPSQWPCTRDIDGYVWNLSEPPHPTKADADWAVENLNGDDWHDDIPDDVWDTLAEEAEARDRIERYGYL